MAADLDYPTVSSVAQYSHAKVSLIDLHYEAGKVLREVDELRAKVAYLSNAVMLLQAGP